MEKQTQKGDFLDNGRCCLDFYRNCVQNGVLTESHFVSVIKCEGLDSNFNFELCGMKCFFQESPDSPEELCCCI